MSSDERDAILMMLVESALARNAKDRRAFFASVETQYPDLLDEVRDRVAWEDRMGGFLREPVILAQSQSQDRPFTAGELVEGRYRIGRELGRGGVGVTYEAFDEETKCRVAIKHGRLPNAQFVVMEFVEGERLADRIEREGPLAEKEVRKVALQISSTLAKGHRQGVVHGAIHAGNVLLSPSRNAILMDLGQRSTGAVASDIYALGVLFHVMLTGKTITRRTPGTPVTVDLPPPWKRIVGRCIENQFASVDQVIALLSRRLAISGMVVAALAILVVVTALIWRWRADAGAPMRLVVLPVTVEGPPIAFAEGLGIEVADRLLGMGPREALRNRVDTAAKAMSTLGATHVLRVALRNLGSRIAVAAELDEAASGQVVRNMEDEYPAADAGRIANAVLALVGKVPPEPVSAAAYPEYVEGLACQDPNDAVRHLRKAAQLDRRAAEAYARLAEAQISSQWLDAAGASLASAKSIGPDSVAVLLASGRYAQARGDVAQAIADYSRATTLEPRNAEGWHRLAVSYEQCGRNADVISTYLRAMAAQPDNYHHYLALGAFYLDIGEFPHAEERYGQATIVAPGQADGYAGLGLALLRQGKRQEAENVLLESLRRDRTAQVMASLGTVYFEQGRFQESARLFEDVIALGPPSAAHYLDMGNAYRHLGRLKDAGQAYLSGRRLAEDEAARNPSEADCQALLALLDARLGDAPAAELAVTHALAFQPRSVTVMRDAAMVYQILHGPERAVEILRLAPAFLREELSRDSR